MRVKIASFLIIFSYLLHSYNPLKTSENCIFLYGGGYSGYWYTLSRLKKSFDRKNRFICYSSACVSLVHRLLNHDLKLAILKSDKIQQQLIEKNSNLTEIRLKLIDTVMEGVTDKKIKISNYNLEILTTNKFGKCELMKPVGNVHLRKLLRETTYVPGVTGNYDEKIENYDGGMCIGKPKCETEINVPFDYLSWVKAFVYNLSIDDKNYFISLD